jgi:transposase
VGTSSPSSHQHQKKRKKDFTIVSLDESFFFYDSLVKRVWIEEGKRPVVRITGSHQYSCLFGAVDIKGKQLFRQYNKFNADTFLDFLKIIHSKFPRCYLFLDKAPQHYKSRRVKEYLEENKDTLIPVYLPTASPEFMILEEMWNIAKHDLLVLEYYSSFEDFRQKISNYFRTKRFGLNMRNYLLRSV